MKRKIVVLTGAGISAESGMSTFRDSDGLWNNYRVEDVATPEGFVRNPQLVLDFYNGLHRQLRDLQPNFGHVGLAELQQEYDVEIITQNIDNLHEKAGSRSVLHLHGELTKARSTRNEDLVTDWPFGTDLHIGDKASDGAQLRPFIVWFEESVPNIVPASQLAAQADIFLIVGTSLNVYPAAGLIGYVPAKVPVYLIDPKPVKVPTDREVHVIAKGASEGMRDFMKQIKYKWNE